MEERIKKKIQRSLLVLWLIWGIIFAVLAGVLWRSGEIYLIASCLPTKKISAGEDLSKYHGRRVRCEFRYVVNHVVNFYNEGDPSKKIYTCGYLAADDNMQHPFCVFVPPEKADLMDEMRSKTRNIMDGQKESIAPIEITGYVCKTKAKNEHYHIEAFKDLYGNSYPRAGVTYYIDDGAVARGGVMGIDPSALIAYLIDIPFLLILLFLVIATIRSFQYPKVIEEFTAKNHMSRYELEKEFMRAMEVDNIWISPELTFFYTGMRFGILKNREIVWAYVQRVNTGRSTTYRLKLFSKDHRKCASLPVYMGKEKTLSYYEKNCPYIVIGNDRETRRLYKQDFERFLRMRYYENVNKEIDRTSDYSTYDRESDQPKFSKRDLIILALVIIMLVLRILMLEDKYRQREKEETFQEESMKEDTITDSLTLTTQQLIACQEVKALMERSVKRYMGKVGKMAWDQMEEEDQTYYYGEKHVFCQKGELHFATTENDKVVQIAWKTPFTQEKLVDVYKCLRHCYEEAWRERPDENVAIWRLDDIYVELFELDGQLIVSWTDREYRDANHYYD
ncbi:MAG: hypothetical protein E7294_07120 [Lachnospiraceae bacterium]|jgi:hypothetical protein|nr:hypothetical protein [Lachnospiraceae bacterium]